MPVKVYGTAQCMPCRSTKRHLDKINIEYSFVDVSQDPSGHETITALGYQTVPVVIAPDGTHFQGFQPDRLNALKE